MGLASGTLPVYPRAPPQTWQQPVQTTGTCLRLAAIALAAGLTAGIAGISDSLLLRPTGVEVEVRPGVPGTWSTPFTQPSVLEV